MFQGYVGKFLDGDFLGGGRQPHIFQVDMENKGGTPLG